MLAWSLALKPPGRSSESRFPQAPGFRMIRRPHGTPPPASLPQWLPSPCQTAQRSRWRRRFATGLDPHEAAAASGCLPPAPRPAACTLRRPTRAVPMMAGAPPASVTRSGTTVPVPPLPVPVDPPPPSQIGDPARAPRPSTSHRPARYSVQDPREAAGGHRRQSSTFKASHARFKLCTDSIRGAAS